MVATYWEPKQRDPKAGEEFQRMFTRTSRYTNVRKTESGIAVEYRVVIDWKTYYLDEQGKPMGKPFDLTSYDTKFEINLAAYPGHERLRGIFRVIGVSQDSKPREVGPEEYERVTMYLSTDDKGREVLRMDVNSLFPRIDRKNPSKTVRLVDYDYHEMLWLEDGHLQQRQLWRDYLVESPKPS